VPCRCLHSPKRSLSISSPSCSSWAVSVAACMRL
jgi:hypothetical protein